MAFRRPVVLFCIMTIVLGVSRYKISRSPFLQLDLAFAEEFIASTHAAEKSTTTQRLQADIVRSSEELLKVDDPVLHCSRKEEEKLSLLHSLDPNHGHLKLFTNCSWRRHSDLFDLSDDQFTLLPSASSRKLRSCHGFQSAYGSASRSFRRRTTEIKNTEAHENPHTTLLTHNSGRIAVCTNGSLHCSQKHGCICLQTQVVPLGISNKTKAFSTYRPHQQSQHQGAKPKVAESLSQVELKYHQTAYLIKQKEVQPNGTDFRCLGNRNDEQNMDCLHPVKNFDISSFLLKNDRYHVKMETSALKLEHTVVLFSIITLMVCRNEALKDTVISWLDVLPEVTCVRQLINAALIKTPTVNDTTKSSVNNDPDCKVPSKESRIGYTHNLSSQQGLKTYQSNPTGHDLEQDTAVVKPDHVLPYVSSFVPRSFTTIQAFPASFLPSMGSSLKDNMSHLGCRLASLNSLPPSCNMSRVRLAEAGFYYDNSKTIRDASNVHEVVCYSCGVRHSQWKTGDNPTTVHQNLQPACHHLKSFTTDNATSASACHHLKSFTTDNATSASFSSLSSNGTSSLASSGVSSGFTSISESGSGSLSSGYGSGGTSSFSHLSSVSQSSLSLPDSGTGSGFGTREASVPVNTAPHNDNAPGRNGYGSDLATDCAAIAPPPLPTSNHVAQAANQPAFSEPIRNTVASRPPNQSSFLNSRDTSSARAYDLEDRPPLSMSSAVYPQFSRHIERRATFSNWPLSSVAGFHPDHLVMQGFYYAGYADCIRCFYCGVGLKTWAENDEVMVEHIRWRPTCGYVLNTKGRQYVNSVLDRLQLNNSEDHNNNVRESSETATQATSQPQTGSTSSHCTSAASGATAAPSSSAASTAGGNASEEVVRMVEEMGFSRESIARAARRLRQSGLTEIGTDVLVEKLIELDNTTTTDHAAVDASVSELQTDGASVLTGQDSERAKRIVSENQRLKARQTCKICNETKVGMIFLPCGHIVACTQCGPKTRNCSNCGQFIRATANVYLS